MSKTIKSVKAVKANDTIKAVEQVKADTAPKAPAPIKYSHVVLNWQSKDIGLTSGISKTKVCLMGVITADITKIPAINFIEAIGLNTLKNAGVATDTKQVLIKDTDRQSVSWVNEFKKCLDGTGNKKTMSCYINGLAKLTAYDIGFFVKRVSSICKTTPKELETKLQTAIAKHAKAAKTA